MDIVAFSDLHGQLPKIEFKADIALIAGDIVPLHTQSGYVTSRNWFFTEFKKWAEKLPVDHVFFVAGNHDFFLEAISMTEENVKTFDKELGDKITYLYNNVGSYTKGDETIQILGTPLCHQFGRWAFMPTDERMEEMFKNIKLPKKTKIDVVLCHDAPYGVSDRLLQKTYHNPTVPGLSIGSEPLRDYIKKIKPRYCFHGHLHSTNHEEELLGDTKVYNVSLLDEYYKMTYKPLYLKI